MFLLLSAVLSEPELQNLNQVLVCFRGLCTWLTPVFGFLLLSYWQRSRVLAIRELSFGDRPGILQQHGDRSQHKQGNLFFNSTANKVVDKKLIALIYIWFLFKVWQKYGYKVIFEVHKYDWFINLSLLSDIILLLLLISTLWNVKRL